MSERNDAPQAPLTEKQQREAALEAQMTRIQAELAGPSPVPMGAPARGLSEAQAARLKLAHDYQRRVKENDPEDRPPPNLLASLFVDDLLDVVSTLQVQLAEAEQRKPCVQCATLQASAELARDLAVIECDQARAEVAALMGKLEEALLNHAKDRAESSAQLGSVTETGAKLCAILHRKLDEARGELTALRAERDTLAEKAWKYDELSK